MSSSSSHSTSRVLQNVEIGFIGAGTMGRALIQGLLAQGVAPRHLLAAEANPQTRRAAARQFGVRVVEDNGWVARHADILVLAVKPQQFPELIAGLRPQIRRRHLVISIAAGITLRWLRARLPPVALARVMPNLPATVGCGFSALTWGRGLSRRHRAMARAIFEAVGEIVELPERSFDAVTAVSGSGPAYVFFLAQAWAEAARALGLPKPVAEQAIRQTLEGSARLLRTSRDPAAVLIGRVASKGGTTDAALRVLSRRRVAASFGEALRAAAARSRAFAWE